MSVLRKLTRCFTSVENLEVLSLKSLATSIQNDIDNLRPTNVFVDSSVTLELSIDDAYKIQAYTRYLLVQALLMYPPSPCSFFANSNARDLHVRHRELREARGEKCVGFKIGCTSRTIQTTFGLDWYFGRLFVNIDTFGLQTIS